MRRIDITHKKIAAGHYEVFADGKIVATAWKHGRDDNMPGKWTWEPVGEVLDPRCKCSMHLTLKRAEDEIEYSVFLARHGHYRKP
ncbi:hypothetical protein SAMN05443432_103239 [Roseovarius litoreus]|uniref:Uncharacterized protein n=1 Tax=Roseovarius litoreus TaxID=1155722 RepID=A0A1M7E7S7_9RHOB|nr:hypothetical protein [Roseovarius litoreus]SHL87804.1 hypothetical protein SAMN05443432_103239 [Roseovarius litoreus]